MKVLKNLTKGPIANLLWTLFLVAVVAYLGYFLYERLLAPPAPMYLENFDQQYQEYFSNNVERPKCMLFYADWCGACKNFKPEWEKLKAIGITGADLIEVNEKDDKDNLQKKYNISAYPTLVFECNGETQHYNGQRTKEGITDQMINFIKDKMGA